ncbi:MAG: lysophospholipid acyltransferase family protein [Ignavibacteria bacterium]
MIKVRHNLFAIFLYKIYIERLLRSHFEKFILLNEMPNFNHEVGLIITPNHFSWWDGFFAEYLMRKFNKRKPYVMMLEKQLKKYWFFKYIGAFSIDQNSIKSIKENITFSKQIIGSNKSYLLFYPQGEIQNYCINIKLKKGLSSIVENSGAYISVISFKIEYSNDKKPSVYCRFGELFSSLELTSDFSSYENAFRENIKSLDYDITNKIGSDLFKR